VEIFRWLGLLGAEDQLLYTRAATIIAMTQIQLPFTILPMLGVMQSISRTHVRAARSLGAGPIYAHIAVYMPQVAPGIAAGAMITFILCLGFYITPALVGGVNDQMVSFFVARFTNEELNWNLAAALSITLLTVTGLAIAFFIRFFNLRAVLR
jgi:putative spermidine/putrescine transport system permease protein